MAPRKRPAWKAITQAVRGIAPRALLVALLVAVVAAPSILYVLGRSPQNDYSAQGYVRLVNDLIAARHWLAVDYEATPPRVKFADPALADNPALQAFVRSSYLRGDMGSADPGVWVFDSEGRRVKAISASAHNIIGPFADVSGWTGDILFRRAQARTPLIFGQDGSRYALSMAGSGRTGKGWAFVIKLFDEAGTSVAAPRYTFQDGDVVLASATMVGDQVILRVVHVDGARVALSGRAVATAEGQPRLHHWREGETLVISRDGKQRQFTLASTYASISTAQGGRLRTRFPGLESFASGIESSMNADDADRDIHTTLDPGLQSAAQRALDTASERLRGRRPAFPAAMVMMDGLTGEVLALASYPHSPDQLDSRGRASVQPPSILVQNQNFVRLPIGSVAKAPIAMAILEADPRLASLRVQAASEFDKVLGIDLGGTFDDHVSPEEDGFIGFERFLAESSNRYAAALMLMGLGESPDSGLSGPSEPYVLSSGRRDRQPRLPIVNGGVSDTAYILWKLKLERLFEVAADGDLRDRQTLYDSRRFWGPKLTTDRPRGFETVSPARENFGLNDIRKIGTDYVMTILGGNRSRWTTIKVAEAFSRMVTRRPVQARITGDGPPTVDPAMTGPRYVTDAAWQPVMDGLKAVARTGTARRLSEVRFGEQTGEVRIFAKTGTPALERYQGRTPANEALQALVTRGCSLQLYGGRLLLPSAPDATTVRAITAALGRQSGCSTGDGSRREIAGEIVRLNAQMAKNGGSLPGLETRGRTVVSVPRRSQVTTGMGHVIAVVVGVYADPKHRDDQPVRVLTVVVNIQSRLDSNRSPARDAAMAVLRDPAVQAWLMSRPPRPAVGATPAAPPARKVLANG